MQYRATIFECVLNMAKSEAFDDPGELPRTLRAIARQVANGAIRGHILYDDGDQVGTWAIAVEPVTGRSPRVSLCPNEEQGADD